MVSRFQMEQYSDPEKLLQPEEMALAIITAMELPEKIALNTLVARNIPCFVLSERYFSPKDAPRHF